MFDFSTDPTYMRLRREQLEQEEGTPRSDTLQALQACEFEVTQLYEAACVHVEPDTESVHLTALYDDALAHLNEAYLYVSPEASEPRAAPTPSPTPALPIYTTDTLLPMSEMGGTSEAERVQATLYNSRVLLYNSRVLATISTSARLSGRATRR